MLELMGHEIRKAHDGRDVLPAAEAFYPNAILLDIGLPGLNGYDVCRALRENARFANVILIAQTGWAQEKDIRERSPPGLTAIW